MRDHDHHEDLDAEIDDSWRRPPGIFVIAEVEGALGERIHEIQQHVDPKLARSLPPHITLVGSSGIGPYAAEYSPVDLRTHLTPICASTPPLVLPFDPPQRFPQTEIIVLPLRPHGPLRVLHDRLATCGLRSSRARHAFTPHVTLSFFRTLTREVERELLGLRLDEPLVIGHLRCSLTNEPLPPRTLLELPLTGHDASREVAHQFVDLAVEFLESAGRGEGAVSTQRTPEEIRARFDEDAPVDGTSLDLVLARVRTDILADANRLSHPMYLGHQVSAPLPLGAWVDALAASLNNSQAVNEMSPTLSHVERRVVRWMTDAIGWGDGAGGTFTSGGTEASFTAMCAARAHLMPEAWVNGVGADPPVIICGEHTHYAVSRTAGQLGLGVRQVVTVPSDGYAMSIEGLREALDRCRAEGRRVMAVVATAGQTATGAFDDLEGVADACEAHGVWMHVDGAHGASAVLSERHRHRLSGIQRAHSVAWDPHKMMLLPISAGAVLVREVGWMDAAFAQRAPYLFQEGAVNWNIGPRSFQCSRRGDVLKVWVAWQRYGTRGFAAMYELLCDLTIQLHALLQSHQRFVVLHEPQCNILCFRWVGGAGSDSAATDRLNALLRDRYNRSGDGWITATQLDGRTVLRVTIQNPRTTAAHLSALLEGLDTMGLALLRE
jgi:L-2,4-diaminobutyrate decarboxylase